MRALYQNKKTVLQDKNMKRICILILFSLWVYSVMANPVVPGDSVGTKLVNGKTLVVYKISAGETAYAVSRKYGIPYKDLSAANSGVNMDALKAGQEILVPTAWSNTSTSKTTTTVVKTEPREEIIPQKASTTVVKEQVKEEKPAEQKTEESPKEIAEVTTSSTENTEAILSTTDLSTAEDSAPVDKNKSFAQIYGGYLNGENISMSEKGVATWIESTGIETTGDRYYALHNSAPIGSVVKVRNLMNNRTIYAKVIGTLSESEVQEKVLIKLSAGAAERLNVLDNRFVSEITYFVPDEKASK